MINPAACIAIASSYYHVPKTILFAIQRLEGGATAKISINKDGTEDLGLMQINTKWITPLKRTTKKSTENIYERLKRDDCYNIAVAAAIIKLYSQQTKGNLIKAAGLYYSHTPYLNQIYQSKILRAMGLKFLQRKKTVPYFSSYQKRFLKIILKK
ncbi:hypothetical protein COMNV_00656 [Commensalibacter sp. Nvir]|uniref:lytic transglycosylase domain-containing protein n=1 Tax=Commensalibacter sp. Nvir TaxID=3069817 RepID=UPI002D389C4B|nr:hypothetical protein COMNV_00656 [Commensalibacter sp. Nvir]